MSTRVPKHSDGAQANNQNARRHGWTSRTNPAPIANILAAVDEAAATDDLATLRHAKRALRWRGEHGFAADTQNLIEMVQYHLRETANNSAYAPESIVITQERVPEPQHAPDRIARAHIEYVPWSLDTPR